MAFNDMAFNDTVLNDEDEKLRSVALQNAHSILQARMQAEDALRRQSEWLRVTLASIGDAVISTDMEGRITFMNGVAESLTGFALSEAKGQPLHAVFNIVNESTRQTVGNPALRALAEGTIVGLANHTILVARDGTEWPIDDSAAPIRDADGNLYGAVLVFREITERKRAEAQSSEHDRRFRALVDQIGDYAIFTIDTAGRPSSWNEGVGRVLGFMESEFVGQDVFPIIFTPEDVRSGVPGKELDQAATTGRASDDRWMLKKDGKRFYALGAVTALRDGPGNLLGFMKVMRDQTERKHMEDRLRQVAADMSEADRRKNEFLAMLAHELRNPLAPMSNALQIVQLSADDPKTVQSAAEMMDRHLRHMVRLVDDLLDLSRISQGKIDLRLERVELATVIRRAVETSRAAIESGRHKLTVTLPTGSVFLEGDAVRLSQVFSNLLNNSSKYSEPQGLITVTAQCQDGEVMISVKDTGVGIPADMLPRVFEMFTQVDRSLERSQGGLGIGLALVQNLIALHHGTVTAFSEGPNMGSEFVVHLPIAMAERNSTPAAATEESLSGPSRRILVVDDNRDSAVSLAMILKMTGHRTEIAYDGLAAVAAAESFRPDVILLDIGLPKLNGYEAARRIREQPWGKEIVIVALTGWGQDDDRQKSEKAGFDSHMVKPIEHLALAKLLADLAPPQLESNQPRPIV